MRSVVSCALNGVVMRTAAYTLGCMDDTTEGVTAQPQTSSAEAHAEMEKLEARATEAFKKLESLMSAPQKSEAIHIEEMRTVAARYKADKDAEVALRKIEADERASKLQKEIEAVRGASALELAKNKSASEKRVARLQYTAALGLPLVTALGGWFGGKLEAKKSTGADSAQTAKEQSPPASAPPSAVARTESAPSSQGTKVPSCFGFAGVWKRPQDAEAFIIAATPDCRIVYSAITPRYEQYMTVTPHEDGTASGQLLRRSVADGCVVYLKTTLTKLGADEIQTEVTEVIPGAGTKRFCGLSEGYRERFLIERVK